MAYYMAQVERGRTRTDSAWKAICEEHGVIGNYGDQDAAIDGAADHDGEHGYDGEGDED